MGLDARHVGGHLEPEDRVEPVVDGVERALLDPCATWRDPDAYDRKARELAQMFRDNFARFDADEAVAAAGPRV